MTPVSVAADVCADAVSDAVERKQTSTAKQNSRSEMEGLMSTPRERPAHLTSLTPIRGSSAIRAVSLEVHGFLASERAGKRVADSLASHRHRSAKCVCVPHM